MATQAQAETDLSKLIYDALFKAFMGQGVLPPITPEDGLNRVATSVGTSVIDYLSAHGKLTIPGISALPSSGQDVLITWK
jgi:hypothetical protein